MAKKKIYYYFSLFFVFMCILSTTPTFSKYTGNSQGILWNTKFVGFGDIATEFTITEPKHQVSDKLWGASNNENDDLSTNNSNYTMSALDNVVFSVYNKTEQNMLIKFQITCYILDVIEYFYFYIVNTEVYKSYVNTTSLDPDIQNGEVLYGQFNKWDSFGKNYTSVPMTKVLDANGNEIVYRKVFNELKYVKHQTIIDPSAVISGDDLFDNFVVQRGEYMKFHLRVRFKENVIIDIDDSVWSTYSSIKMVAEPIDMVDPNPDTPVKETI